MKNIFLLLFLEISTLGAAFTGFVPSERQALESNYYIYDPLRGDECNFYQLIDRYLQTQKIPFRGSDLTGDLSDAHAFLFFNIPVWVKDWKDTLKKIPHKKRILLTFEPPVVFPEMFSTNILAMFSKVLTWDDDLVDNIKYFKICFPVLQQMIADVVAFPQKKLLTQISANKSFPHPKELYTERLNCILHFENKNNNDFDFYGVGWENCGFRNYKGAPVDKIAVLKNYRFSICYENTKEVRGYITEKIFDCFHAGVVPIYWGASNVREYIPSNCFIDRRLFHNFDDLLTHLKNMNEETYNRYLENIREYLKSRRAKKFSKEEFARSVLEVLLKD